MPPDNPIGIDLGTTNSAMAWVDGTGRSAMVLNAEGEAITPSVVYFSETEVVVGKNARTAITAHPDMVAQWVKREMGAPFYSHPIHGHYLPPEVIQACILRKLKADLVRAVGSDIQTVITVPAYFDEMRRKATADAGDMAGLRVLDIVNEPTAAAIAFGEALGYLNEVSPQPQVRRPRDLVEDEALGYLTDGPGPMSAGVGSKKQDLNVLVYDLGGGTFDVTLLRLSAGKVQTLATDGDVQLGGHDWDQRLVDLAADAFVKQHNIDPRQDPATLNRLYLDAMEAKHTLSARNRAVVQINFQGRSAETAVTREQFEEMSADLLERTAFTSRQVLGVAGLEWRNLQRILLVGGSTRMPMVARMLQNLTGIQPDRTVNPDEAVARGAALYASHLLAARSGGALSTFQVTNVNSHSLGVEGIETETLRKKNVVLIPRNTALPARHMERFATKVDGQRSIVIKVLEGESAQPGDCIAIGRTAVRDLPAGLPKGWPVEVTFSYGTNGRLMVEALVPGTNHHARLELVREAGLSNEGLARWRELIDSAAGINAFTSAAKDLHDSDVIEMLAGGDTDWGLAVQDRAKAGTTSAPVDRSSKPQPLSGGVAQASEPNKQEEPAVPPVSRANNSRERRIPLWLERLIGHIVTMILFGIVGYLMISHFRPDLFPSWFGHGRQQNEQKQSSDTP
jgi:molecular chaperone DnaK